MATIPCTEKEFNKAWCKFNTAIGDKRNSQESIAAGWHGLSLQYLGLQNVTAEQLEKCADVLKMAHSGAVARGWDL